MTHIVQAYDSEAGLFEISHSEGSRLVLRSLCDLRALSRKHKQHPLPSHLDRKLQSQSWRVNGEGWEKNKTKVLASLNSWLNDTLNDIDEVLQRDFLDDTYYEARRQEKLSRIDREAPARALQQYFASATNINSLVSQLRESIVQYGRENLSVIEPSFGDGRLLEAMLNCVVEDEAVAASVQLVGVEIDPIVSTRARERLDQTLSRVKLPPTSNLRLVLSNFLVTTREELGLLEGCTVIVVGSPPYTAGGGTGSLTSQGSSALDTGRDLPLKFLVHCAAKLRARLIVFLMPQRCSKATFVDRALSEMCRESGVVWRLARQQEADGAFDFADRRITQPAVIQVYEWCILSTDATPLTSI